MHEGGCNVAKILSFSAASNEVARTNAQGVIIEYHDVLHAWDTNSMAEGINSKIMSIKRRAGGYRNIENFKKAIYF